MKNRFYAGVDISSCLVFVSVGAVMFQPTVLDFKVNTYPGPSSRTRLFHILAILCNMYLRN